MVFYRNEQGTLYCGDCIKIMKTLPAESIDFILTSPPYNLGIEYDFYKDKRPYEEYLDFLKAFLKESYRLLKPDGRLVVNHYLSCGTAEFRFAPLMDINYIATREVGFKHHGLAVWNDTTVVKRTAWGSYLSPSAPYVSSPFEGFLILYKQEWKKRNEKENKGINRITKKEFQEFTSGILKVYPEKKWRKKHPAPFPEKISDLFIKCLTYEGDVVLDPFAGIGTTLASAQKLKRKWIGIELSPNYCKEAVKRIKAYENLLW